MFDRSVALQVRRGEKSFAPPIASSGVCTEAYVPVRFSPRENVSCDFQTGDRESADFRRILGRKERPFDDGGGCNHAVDQCPPSVPGFVEQTRNIHIALPYSTKAMPALDGKGGASGTIGRMIRSEKSSTMVGVKLCH